MKRVIIAGAAGIAAVAAVTASAASLGAFQGEGVGAGQTVVASCNDDTVTVTYTKEYSSDDSRYNLTAVSFYPLSALCDDLPYEMTLAGEDGQALVDPPGTYAGDIPIRGNDDTVTIQIDDTTAADSVYNVALIITDPPA